MVERTDRFWIAKWSLNNLIVRKGSFNVLTAREAYTTCKFSYGGWHIQKIENTRG